MIRDNGCQPIPLYPSQEPFMVDFARNEAKAYKGGYLNGWSAEQFKKVGSLTYRIYDKPVHQIYTSDPAIYQRIASDLENWEREDRRGGKPFLGVQSGIQNTNVSRRLHLVVPAID